MEKRRINVRGIVYRDEKLLAVKHTSKKDDSPSYWCLPGGGVDEFESLEEAMSREIIEELGVTPNILGLISGQQFKSKREGRDEELELYYLLEDSPEYDHIELANTSHGIEEISEVCFINPADEFFLPKFIAGLNLKEFVEKNKPIQIINNLGKKTI